MEPAVQDITIYVGRAWSMTLMVKDDGVTRDLTGCAFVMHIRDAAGTALLVTLDADNGRVVITPAAGKVDFKLPASATAIDAPQGIYEITYIPQAGVEWAEPYMVGAIAFRRGVLA